MARAVVMEEGATEAEMVAVEKVVVMEGGDGGGDGGGGEGGGDGGGGDGGGDGGGGEGGGDGGGGEGGVKVEAARAAAVGWRRRWRW